MIFHSTELFRFRHRAYKNLVPTNNLDPASRGEILRALATFTRAVVMVSYDLGAFTALNPKIVLILPEDHVHSSNSGCEEFISLS